MRLFKSKETMLAWGVACTAMVFYAGTCGESSREATKSGYLAVKQNWGVAFSQAAWSYYDNKKGSTVSGFEGRDEWNKRIKEQEKQRKN
ncbi:unnamed protein product [Pylaiella littoralis]